MIHSMTGYAAVTRDIGLAILNLELKSVNSRYFDINFRLAEELRFLEMPLRELISTRVSRGKIECRAGLNSSTAVPRELAPNETLLAQLSKLQERVRAILPHAAALSVSEALRWPGVLADQALANTPVFEGTQVITAEDGRAELQFDDGSVIRISPNSSLTIAELRGQSGGGDAEIVLESGLGYFELQGEGTENHVRVRFADSVVTASEIWPSLSCQSTHT